MKSLRGIGLACSLLFVGVLGGLMAPLSSEAGNPTLTIDGVPVALVSIPCGTDTAYNSCWKIPAGTYNGGSSGGWTVGDVSSSNQARVLIGDKSTVGSVDSMKMTGVKFKPIVAAGAPGRTVHAIVQNVYNVGGGNLSGDYQWSMAQGGQFDPPSTENIVGNRLKLTGTGTASGVSFALGVLDTGTFTSSTIPNVIGYVTKSKPASVVKANCNTGSNKCAPTIKYDYEITVVGADELFLTDSVAGDGGPCYKGLKLVLAKIIDHIFDHFDNLKDDEHPLGCQKFAAALNVITQDHVDKIVQAGIASGGVAAETCLGACIVINKTTDPELTLSSSETPATFGFTVTGSVINNFTLTTDGGMGGETITFSGLADGAASARAITETGFPFVSDSESAGGDGDHDKFWWTRDVNCVSANNPGGVSAEPPLTTWTTVVPTFATVNTNRAALGNNDPLPTFEIDALRQGSVTVTNLAAGDTLTCTFVNRLFNDDVPNNDPNSD